MPLRFFQCLNRQRTAQSRKRPRTAKGELRPSWLYPLRHEGEMRGLAVIFRCINYMGNSLGKVKILTILKATGSDSVFGPDYAISLA